MKGFLITAPPLNVYEQMAFDEALALSANGKEVYLRFFNWKDIRAVTFGYAQFFNEVDRQLKAAGFDAPATRRPTGGGVVFHDGDITFSIISPLFTKKVRDVYSVFHAAINKRLAENKSFNLFDKNLPAAAYAPSNSGEASACFSNPVEHDLLDGAGQKVLGGAIRKFERALLYQGSYQEPLCRGNEEIEIAIKNALSDIFGITWQELEPAGIFLKKIKQTAAEKYASDAWIKKF